MDNEKIKELMEELGFDFRGGIGREPSDSPAQRVKFQALQKLLVGAILDRTDLDYSEDELLEWTEEWLVG